MEFRYNPILLLILGFCAGITSGFYGIGGGWLVTPVLNILGFPMPYAIGTSLVYIIITSTLGTIKHRKLKNVNYLLGSIIGVTAILGAISGKEFIFYLEKLGNVDTVIRIAYIVFLIIIGSYMMFENKLKKLKKDYPKKEVLPPFVVIRIDGQENIKISLWKLLFTGFFAGGTSSTLGVGGGVVLLPILIYIVKIPVTLAIGTSLFTIMIASLSGGIAYILSNRVVWQSLIYMVIATIISVSLGATATKKVNPHKIKILFAITVLCGSLAILFKQLHFHLISNIVIFVVAIFSSLVIIFLSYIKA